MRKVQFKVNSKKTITAELPDRLEIWLIYLLQGLGYFTGVMLLLVFTRGLVTDTYTTISFLKLLSVGVILLGTLRLLMMLFGGVRFFPESRFDLTSLLFAIALISTLLTKQLFDLERSGGMLPSNRYWYISIYGILAMLLITYLVDIYSRSEKVRKGLVASLVIFIPLFTAIYMLLGQEILPLTALSLLAIAPFVYTGIFTTANRYTKILLFLVFLFVVSVAMLSLEAEINLLFAITGIGVGAYLVRKTGLSKSSFARLKQQILKIKSREFSFTKVSKELFPLGILVPSILYVIVFIILLLAGKQELAVIQDGLQSNWDAIKNADGQTLFIGGRLEYANSSYFANIFSSFGSLGAIFFLLFLGHAFYTALKNLVGKEKLDIALLFSLAFFIILAFLVNITDGFLIILFLIIGLVGSQAMKPELTKIKVIDFDFIKDRRLKIGLVVCRYLLAILLIILAIYGVFNIEDILVSL